MLPWKGLSATLEGFECYPGSGIRQNLGTDVGLEKETIFEIAMKEVRDAGFS